MKKVKNFYQSLTALVFKEENWYVAKCLEVEVASQGKTKKEALKNLKEALELYFEDEKKIEFKLSYQDVSLEKISFSYA
jgi:predicted RNase H-like HicB family nuclease